MEIISYNKFPSQLGFIVAHSIISLLTLLIYSLAPCIHNLVFNFLFCMQFPKAKNCKQEWMWSDSKCTGVHQQKTDDKELATPEDRVSSTGCQDMFWHNKINWWQTLNLGKTELADK